MTTETETKLPEYRCHKRVRAWKIKSVEPWKYGQGGAITDVATLSFYGIPGESFPDIVVSAEYVERHNPQIGGYYVRFADGYESYSPAEAFEIEYSQALASLALAPLRGPATAPTNQDIENLLRCDVVSAEPKYRAQAVATLATFMEATRSGTCVTRGTGVGAVN